MSGQPHDDRRSEQPDSELDPDQNVDEADQQYPASPENQPEAGSGSEFTGPISAPSGWELDDDIDATRDLPAVRIPSQDDDAESHDSSVPQDQDPAASAAMEEMWDQLLNGQATSEPDHGTEAAEDDREAAEDNPETAPEDADPNDDVTVIAEPYSPDLLVDPATQAAEDQPDVTATAVAAPQGAVPSGPVNAEGLPLRPRERGRRSAKPAKKNRTLLWAILTGVVVVIVAIALILFFALRDNDDKDTQGSTVDSIPTSIQKGSPAAAVRDLGGALKDGDAQGALDLLEISSLQGATNQHPLLNNKVYSKASNRPQAITPAKESYGVPASNALTSGVTATLSQGGKKQQISLRLTRADADAPWKVATASLPALDVTDGGGAKVKANTVDVTLPGKTDDYSTHRLFVLPGNYTIQRTDTKFVNYPKAKSFQASGLAVASDPDPKATDLGSTSLAGTLNSAFKKEANKSVDSWLNACIASTEIAPKQCPFGADAGGKTVENIKWTLDKEPTKSYPDLSVNNATVEGKDGQASVEATVKQDGEDAKLEADMNFQFTGTLTIKGNKVTFTYTG